MADGNLATAGTIHRPRLLERLRHVNSTYAALATLLLLLYNVIVTTNFLTSQTLNIN